MPGIPITEWAVEEANITQHERMGLQITTVTGVVVGEIFNLSPIWHQDHGIITSPEVMARCLVLYNMVNGRGYILGYMQDEDAAGNRIWPPDMPKKCGDIRITAASDFYNAGLDIFRGGIVKLTSHPIVKMFFNVLTCKIFNFCKSYQLQNLGGILDWQNSTVANLKLRFKSLVKEQHRGELDLGDIGKLIKFIISDGTKDNKQRACVHIGYEGETTIQLEDEEGEITSTLEVTKEGEVDYKITANGTRITVDPGGKIRIETPKEHVIVTERSKLGSEDAVQPMVLGYKAAELLMKHTHPCSGPSPTLAQFPDALSKKHTLDK
jgi:hypothetical protein